MTTVSPSPRQKSAAGAAVTILVILSAAICVLCVIQWVVQSKLRERIEEENKAKNVALARASEQEAQAKRYSFEIERLDKESKGSQDLIRSNKFELSALKLEVNRLTHDNEKLTNSVETYKAAYEKANAAILQQNEAVKTQNAALKTVAEERNALAEKYNKLAEDYNKAVTEFNNLVEQVKKEREAAAQAAEKEKK